MLLCLCSKNNEADVVEVFERHPEMPLRREHILAQRINWRSKAENVASSRASFSSAWTASSSSMMTRRVR